MDFSTKGSRNFRMNSQCPHGLRRGLRPVILERSGRQDCVSAGRADMISCLNTAPENLAEYTPTVPPLGQCRDEQGQYACGGDGEK